MASILFTAGILIGIIFLFAFFFSLLHKRSRQKALAKQQAKLDDLVAANNLTLHEKEAIDQYLIAMDTFHAKLLYLGFSNNDVYTMVLDLNKIKIAGVDIEENSIYEEKKGKSVLVQKHVTKLQLALTYKDASQPVALLPFYLSENGTDNYNTLKTRIEDWRDRINKFVKG